MDYIENDYEFTQTSDHDKVDEEKEKFQVL